MIVYYIDYEKLTMFNINSSFAEITTLFVINYKFIAYYVLLISYNLSVITYKLSLVIWILIETFIILYYIFKLFYKQKLSTFVEKNIRKI